MIDAIKQITFRKYFALPNYRNHQSVAKILSPQLSLKKNLLLKQYKQKKTFCFSKQWNHQSVKASDV